MSLKWSISVKTVGLNRLTHNPSSTHSTHPNTSPSDAPTPPATLAASHTNTNQNTNTNTNISTPSKPQPTNFTIQISPDDSLQKLHDEITSITGLSASQQRLIYRGRLIHDSANNSSVNTINGNDGNDGNGNEGESTSGNDSQMSSSSSPLDQVKIKDVDGLADGQTIHLVPKLIPSNNNNTSNNNTNSNENNDNTTNNNNMNASPSTTATISGASPRTGGFLAALLGLTEDEEDGDASSNGNTNGNSNGNGSGNGNGNGNGAISEDGNIVPSLYVRRSPRNPFSSLMNNTNNTTSNTNNTNNNNNTTTSTSSSNSTSNSNSNSTSIRPSHRRSENDPLYPTPGSLEPIRQGLLTLHTIMDSTASFANGHGNGDGSEEEEDGNEVLPAAESSGRIPSSSETATNSTETTTITFPTETQNESSTSESTNPITTLTSPVPTIFPTTASSTTLPSNPSSHLNNYHSYPHASTSSTTTGTGTDTATSTATIRPKQPISKSSPLVRQRKWYKGQLIDLKDTVNQWLEATIVEIMYPQDVMEFPSTTSKARSSGSGNDNDNASASRRKWGDTMTLPYNDPAIGANDHQGRNHLLLQKCVAPPSSSNKSTDADATLLEDYENYTHELATLNNDPSLIGYTPRRHNQSIQLLLVHYNGWPHRWDEWIRSDSDRIRPFRTRSRHFVSVGNGSGSSSSSRGMGMGVVARRGYSAGVMMNGAMGMSPFPQSVFDSAPRTYLERNVNGLEEEEEDYEGYGMNEDDEEEEDDEGEEENGTEDDPIDLTQHEQTVRSRRRRKDENKIENTITIERMAIMKELLRNLDGVSSLLHSALGEEEEKQRRFLQDGNEATNVAALKNDVDSVEEECKMPADETAELDNAGNTRQLPWLSQKTSTNAVASSTNDDVPDLMKRSELESDDDDDEEYDDESDNFPPKKLLSEREYLQRQTKDVDVHRMEALGPVMDRLGRVLIDFAPHMAEASKFIKEQKVKDFHEEQKQQRQRALQYQKKAGKESDSDSVDEDEPESEFFSFVADTATNDEVLTEFPALEEDEATQQHELEEHIDPDYVDFINGFINVSRDNPYGRRHSIRRSSSDASLSSSSLLSTYLATAASNAILENEEGGTRNNASNGSGPTPRVVRLGGGTGGGSLGSGGGSGGPGGIDIHIHAIVTGPGGAGMGNLGLDGLAGLLGDAGPTILGGAMGTTATVTPPPPTTDGAAGSTNVANSGMVSTSQLDDDDDEMGLFSDLYSDFTPTNPTSSNPYAGDEIQDDGEEDASSNVLPRATTASATERSSTSDAPTERPNTSASVSTTTSLPILQSSSNASVSSNTSSTTARTSRSENEQRRNAFLTRLFRRANRRSNE